MTAPEIYPLSKCPAFHIIILLIHTIINHSHHAMCLIFRLLYLTLKNFSPFTFEYDNG